MYLNYFPCIIFCASACLGWGSVSTSNDAQQPGFVAHLRSSVHAVTLSSSGSPDTWDFVASSRLTDGSFDSIGFFPDHLKGDLPDATFPRSLDSRLGIDRELTKLREPWLGSSATEGLLEHQTFTTCFPKPSVLLTDAQRKEPYQTFLQPASYTCKDTIIRHRRFCPAIRASWALVLVRALLRMLEFLGLQLIFLVVSLLLLVFLLMCLKAVEWFLGLSVIDFEFSFSDIGRRLYAPARANGQNGQELTDGGQQNEFVFSFESEEHETANILPTRRLPYVISGDTRDK
ncbi:hypothetical protein NCLIV_031490 [Neospora caninum Liverpool]|uniref:Transmembrane protein n=1 Tax=Neospora caninum (strain Liverpool) TaxID=572307 RepID=F0VI01_NEOCL|nr:hypothetical protein NCLIV_031490 [Neospora caninum Liverpool]CBZ53362.1 hypothetical protein NCLIV_031490 [Neospora caninum Liverpool]CEL67348.1 TPA: hypothetical protein BN1204_031490 [Neospora caninum Liverpool]|eukprot:XP_003883394.1 hypothetical protein NCLIV_031490 [Neospora caninum Liverpool]